MTTRPPFVVGPGDPLQRRSRHSLIDKSPKICDTIYMIPFWRLSEGGEDNLGLACIDDGLRLGRTLLVERRDNRFAVRDRSEIERLLKRAYRGDLAVERLMSGLTTVAHAL